MGKRCEQTLHQEKSTQKDSHDHWSSWKCKLKPQRGITFNRMAKMKRLTIASTNEDTEQLKFSYIAGGNEMVQPFWKNSLAVFLNKNNYILIM